MTFGFFLNFISCPEGKFFPKICQIRLGTKDSIVSFNSIQEISPIISFPFPNKNICSANPKFFILLIVFYNILHNYVINYP